MVRARQQNRHGRTPGEVHRYTTDTPQAETRRRPTMPNTPDAPRRDPPYSTHVQFFEQDAARDITGQFGEAVRVELQLLEAYTLADLGAD